MKLGIIGCGKMGTALLEGVLRAGVVTGADLVVTDAVPDSAAAAAGRFKVTAAPGNTALAEASDAIILCVKPNDALAALEQLRETLPGKLVLSIVAGLRLAALEHAAGPAARIVRVMPNTPAQVHKGASAFALGSQATAEDATLATQIFGAVGVVFQVNEELLDAVTGLSGSGPAYGYVMIEAMADAGVLMGLPRDMALRLSAQTLAGAAEMVLAGDVHPAQLKDMVASPGGTTIAGLEALEAGGFRAAILRAVRASTERSRELGRRST